MTPTPPMHPMHSVSLLGLQARLASYLLQPDPDGDTALQDVRDPSGGPPGPAALRRLSVYHSAYRARLLDTLRDSFGHTARLLGDARFNALALAHIEATPSARDNLRWYGEGWPDALAATVGEDVAELARLDLALRAAFDGPDDAVLTLADLQRLPLEAWEKARLRPHATVQCLRLRHNTLARWHAIDLDETPPDSQPLDADGWLLVWRRDERPHFRSLGAVEAWAVQRLCEGVHWEALCEGLAQAWPDEDALAWAAHCLRRWTEEGVLSALDTEG